MSRLITVILLLCLAALVTGCTVGTDPEPDPTAKPPKSTAAPVLPGPESTAAPKPEFQPTPLGPESQPKTPGPDASTKAMLATLPPRAEPEMVATLIPRAEPEMVATLIPRAEPEILATLTPRTEPEMPATLMPTAKPERVGTLTSRDKPEGLATLMPRTKPEMLANPAPPSDSSGVRHFQPPPEDLKAGEVDDNARWEEYLKFTADYKGPQVHTTSLEHRQIITVLDREGNPVPNARVIVSQGKNDLEEYLTYADGRTLFFPETLQGRPVRMTGKDEEERTRLSVRAERDGFEGNASILPDGDKTHTITLDGTMTYGSNVPLDVLFLLDSTGSMADEIRQIKATLQSIAERVSNLPSNPDLRFGMLSYRDRGDKYVTRLYDFDENVGRFRRTIRDVRAKRGGDYPESLNQALHEAVHHASWREDSIRMIFLIADAPPHLDYPQDEDYEAEMVRAREKGIKIFSVASSGLDEQGEYVFRQIAQQTMGRFLFILYRSGVQGTLETPHDVEQFTVNNLDGLVVRLIEEELAGTEGGEQPGMRMK